MGALRLRDIHKSFGSVEVLKGFDLEVDDGEFIIIVGPSGCGKSTLLRIIAGLEEASSGLVEIDKAVVNFKPPSKRGISMVFQTDALYPHLSVRENMSQGMKQAKKPETEIRQRVVHAANMLSLGELLDRIPSELSGGQRQRVAIGRAIVRKSSVFLFDEPLSNLDATLRVKTRLEISALHRELKSTIIYVTHDQTEAMTLADRIVVLNDGHVEQIGSPMELYNKPANIFVAGFIGSPQMNFIDAEKLGRSKAKTIGIRPEHISVGGKKGNVAGIVSHVEQMGADTNLYLDCDKIGMIAVRLFGQHSFEIGSKLKARFEPDRVYSFDDAGNTIA